ncbi:MAG TPA: NB-ARC domain-containing protein [Streptosporangiaceae bacterium]|nr:NB-ARC domain-containing protein [Streptosporangiaceae bacterium]
MTGNLPAELTSFVGRRAELAEVKRLLAESRLVTLTGVGGVGKTRLALRAAAGLRRAFRDGVWLVQLDQLRDEALVTQAVAETLGLDDRAGHALATTLTDYLAGRELLLVLDNCEHLVDAVAKLADLLLRAAAGLRILATSRETLNITGETVYAVPPLRAPEAGRQLSVAELARFPAPGLFAERAAQVLPGFALTEANTAAVAGICRRLEGLPLAIELAAARLPVLSPEQIEARLGARLDLLTRGGRTQPARQQTLRASIEWSYELCSQAERLLWARLSVFADGFELDAAEGICADHRLAVEQVLELLAALAGKVKMRLEVDIISVSDVDRAKEFYTRLGWRLDNDVAPLPGLRIVQLTPPGSPASITFGQGLTTATPGSATGGLIVSNIEAAHAELAGRGIEASDIWHGPPFPAEARQPGPDPQRTSYGSFFAFTDPDGNNWLVQEVTTRRPGVMD